MSSSSCHHHVIIIIIVIIFFLFTITIMSSCCTTPTTPFERNFFSTDLYIDCCLRRPSSPAARAWPPRLTPVREGAVPHPRFGKSACWRSRKRSSSLPRRLPAPPLALARKKMSSTAIRMGSLRHRAAGWLVWQRIRPSLPRARRRVRRRGAPPPWGRIIDIEERGRERGPWRGP